MKIVDNMLVLTWKEDLRGGPAFIATAFPLRGHPSVPRWKRLLAPVQHWFACTFLGHTEFDPLSFSNFSQYTVPGTGAPKYEIDTVSWEGKPLVLVDRLPE